MPRLLKRGSIQRLDGALGALRLALFGLAIPQCSEQEASPSENAPEIGLIGTSGELALSACIYEILGPAWLRKTDGRFLVAREVLDAFRRMVRSDAPRLSVLTRGIANPGAHVESLLEAASPFSVLFSARAGGLHTGSGASRDVCLASAAHVGKFLEVLGRGNRWAPYMRDAPVIPDMPRQKVMVAEEIARALSEEGSSAAIGKQLKSIFLILPELSSDSPDWLAAFDRVQVAPRASDITILLSSLRNASTGDLARVGRGASGIAARIENDNPVAFPVAAVRFRRIAADLGERFYTDISEANTYLEKGILHPPPIPSLYEYFAVGIEELGLPQETLQDGLTGHEAWPFVAAALAYSGTPGPVFFIAAKTRQSEGGQLLSILTRASSHSTFLKKRLAQYSSMLKIVIDGSPATTEVLLKTMGTEYQARLERRENLARTVSKRRGRGGSAISEAFSRLEEGIQEDESLTRILEQLVAEPELLGRATTPTLRDLIDSVTEMEELPPLLELLRQSDNPLCTNARKAIRALDFSQHFMKAELRDGSGSE